MNVLVIGSGGREHSLVWKIRQSKRVDKIFCAPGNAGIKELAHCVDIGATDVEALVRFATENDIDLSIVGPEASLVEGVVDAFEDAGLRIFGPRRNAAILEGSKVFTKNFLKKYEIPTAAFKVFDDAKKAKKYIEKCGAPIVVKADGLAAGKGVIVAANVADAFEAVDRIMKKKEFGDAGDCVVVEQCLIGQEASFIAFTDGKTVLPLPSSQDHKPVYENDQGPNTGGMGAYSPAPIVTDEINRFVMDRVMLPTIRGMAAEGRPFKGMLYAGLMITDHEVNVLEFNCRFGDPEAQPLVMRLKSDIIDIFEAAIDGRLDEIDMKIDPRPTVCVVMSSGGYPGSYQTGKRIKGLSKAAALDSVEVFHAGTAVKNGRTVTAGGRVLGITAIGKDLRTAIDTAYAAVEQISWTGCYYRGDIGHKALFHTQKSIKLAAVGILMGSDSDFEVMKEAAALLTKFKIPYKMTVASAHRTPERVLDYCRQIDRNNIKVIIAGAGMAAHLAGVVAAHTIVPVIGVPLSSSTLGGLDALLSTSQMPPGIPVATMGIGSAGAKNAAILAAEILAVHDEELAAKLHKYRAEMNRSVMAKAARVEAQ